MSWFDVLTTQMPIFILFVSAGVLFDGAFPLWIFLMSMCFLLEQQNFQAGERNQRKRWVRIISC